MSTEIAALPISSGGLTAAKAVVEKTKVNTSVNNKSRFLFFNFHLSILIKFCIHLLINTEQVYHFNIVRTRYIDQ